MATHSQRIEQALHSVIQKNPILPLKVKDGILVGDVLIKNQGTVKHLYRNGQILYKEISLNVAAIALANLLARRSSSILVDNIYTADQEYGRWFTDSQMLRAQYQKARTAGLHDKADTLWAKYCESRDRTATAKNRAETLAAF